MNEKQLRRFAEDAKRYGYFIEELSSKGIHFILISGKVAATLQDIDGRPGLAMPLGTEMQGYLKAIDWAGNVFDEGVRILSWGEGANPIFYYVTHRLSSYTLDMAEVNVAMVKLARASAVINFVKDHNLYLLPRQ